MLSWIQKPDGRTLMGTIAFINSINIKAICFNGIIVYINGKKCVEVWIFLFGVLCEKKIACKNNKNAKNDFMFHGYGLIFIYRQF